MKLKTKLAKIGSAAKIDPGVIIGYKPERLVKITKALIGKGALIRSNTVIYANTKIGDNLKTGHNVVIREQNNIGNNLNIWNNSTIDYGCCLGHNIKIHNNVYVAQYTTIEDNVFLAPGVIIANDLHPICTRCMRGPTIKQGARIGVNATILPRITIGRNALVGAGSVVTKDVPDNAVVSGVPAKVVAKISDLRCKARIKQKAYEVEG